MSLPRAAAPAGSRHGERQSHPVLAVLLYAILIGYGSCAVEMIEALAG